VKYSVRDWRNGQQPGELDVGVKNYLLRGILEILLKSFLFATASIIVSVVSVNIAVFVRPRSCLLQYILLTKYLGD